MFMELSSDTYQPGETINGRIFTDHFAPNFHPKLILKIEGRECFPRKLYEKVFLEQIGQNPRKFENLSTNAHIFEIVIWI